MAVIQELLARAVLALVGLPILIACAYFGGWPLLVLVAVITLIGMGEYYSAALRVGIIPAALVGYLGVVALLAVTAFGPAQQRELALIVVLAVTVAAIMVSRFPRGSYEGATVDSAVTIFGVVYVGLLMSFLIRLANFDLPAALGEPAGLFAAKTKVSWCGPKNFILFFSLSLSGGKGIFFWMEWIRINLSGLRINFKGFTHTRGKS